MINHKSEQPQLSGQTKCQDGRCSGVQPPCQGYHCNFNTENHQTVTKGQFEDITDEFHTASTIRTFRQDVSVTRKCMVCFKKY